MSKVSSAFGGGKGEKKPSHLEIVAGLAQAARDKELAKSLGGAVSKVANAGSASSDKFQKGRLAKKSRLKRGGGAGGPGVDDENNGSPIKRPGVRTAQLLGS